MTTRSEWIAQLQTTLDELDARIDDLEARGRRKEGAAKTEITARIAALRENRDAARQKLSDVDDAGDSAWEQLKDGAGKAWHQIAGTMKEAKEAFEEGLEHGEEGR